MNKNGWRVGFDARLAGSHHAGIGRYSEELLRSLLDQTSASNLQWIIFVHDLQQLPWLKSSSQVELRVSKVKHYTLAEQTKWWWQLQTLNLDLLHVPHFNIPVLYQGKLVVTIHDLLWHTHRDPQATTLPSWQHRLKYGAYRFVSQQAMLKAEKVLVPTNMVKKQVTKQIGKNEKVIVTSEGLSESYLNVPPVNASKKSKPKKERAPYFVYTGSLYPHKNVEVALQALTKLPQWEFYVVTARNVFTDQFIEKAKQLGVGKQVKIKHHLPDEQLINLYQNAVTLIQPSTAEGFGLTGLEAMAAGCSVIASQIPIFEEVYGPYFHAFDPRDPNQLAQLLTKIYQAPDSAKRRKQAQVYAHNFSWAPVANKTWQVYQDLLA